MTFGERLRELRKAKNLSQRALAEKVGINFTYLSKVESEKLDFAQYPSEDLIRKLAKALEADVDELLLLAKKIPDRHPGPGDRAARRLPQDRQPGRRGAGRRAEGHRAEGEEK